MKICVTAVSNTLDSQLEPRFGRAPYFIIADTDTMEWEGMENPASMAMGGAGIQAAQTMINKNVKAVITGNCGPNAFQVLQQAGIKVFSAYTRTVREVIEDYKAGKLTEFTSPNVPGHFGESRR